MAKQKYNIFIPNEIDIPVKKIELTDLSKKDIEDAIKSTLDDKVYNNKQFTYYKQNDEMCIISFKNKIPETPKGIKYLIPIYSIFKTFTRSINDNVYIIGSVKYGVLTTFMGNEIQTYDCVADESSLIEFINTKIFKIKNNYGETKKIKIFLDTSIDSIDADEVDFDSIEVSTLDKSEILDSKTKFEMILEKINIRIKLDLSLYKIFKTFISSILYFLIGFLFYQNYKQGEQLNMFYSKLETNVDNQLGKLNEKYIKDLEEKIKENKTSEKIIEDLKKNIAFLNNKISNEMDLSKFEMRFNMIDKNIQNIQCTPTKNTKVDDKQLDESKVDETKQEVKPEVKVEIPKVTSYNFEVLVKSTNYMKIKVNNTIYSFQNGSTLKIDDNTSFSYKNGLFMINDKSYNIDNTKGVIQL